MYRLPNPARAAESRRAWDRDVTPIVRQRWHYDTAVTIAGSRAGASRR